MDRIYYLIKKHIEKYKIPPNTLFVSPNDRYILHAKLWDKIKFIEDKNRKMYDFLMGMKIIELDQDTIMTVGFMGCEEQ